MLDLKGCHQAGDSGGIIASDLDICRGFVNGLVLEKREGLIEHI